MGPTSHQWNLEVLPKTGVSNISQLHYYPQSNGKVENADKTIKQLFSKCKESGQSEYMALLDWRNIPSEGISASPAQSFLGQQYRTTLPANTVLLHPQFPTHAHAKCLNNQKE